MNRLVSTFALVFAAAGLGASAYLMPAPGATTAPAGVTDTTTKPPIAKAAAPTAAQGAAPQVAKAIAPPPPTTTAKPASTISTARPPVPLLVSRRSAYVGPESQQEQPKSAETSVAENATPSDAAAKAMIEADGYKRVTGLAKGPDGKWRGRALRGATEVAVSVDAGGSVSTQ